MQFHELCKIIKLIKILKVEFQRRKSNFEKLLLTKTNKMFNILIYINQYFSTILCFCCFNILLNNLLYINYNFIQWTLKQ